MLPEENYHQNHVKHKLTSKEDTEGFACLWLLAGGED